MNTSTTNYTVRLKLSKSRQIIPLLFFLTSDIIIIINYYVKFRYLFMHLTVHSIFFLFKYVCGSIFRQIVEMHFCFN